MFDKLKSIAKFAVVTRGGIGSSGPEVKRIYDRFGNDPAVASVDVKRRNLAMGIPGFVEGSITTKDSLPDATLTSLALTLSQFLGQLTTHAEIRPLTLTADGVSMRVGKDEGDVGKQIPFVLSARADASLMKASFSVISGNLHCQLVMVDAGCNPDAMEQTFLQWSEALPSGACITLRNDSGSISFSGTPTDIPLAMFRVWKAVGEEFSVQAVMASQTGVRPGSYAGADPALTLTVSNDSDIRAVYDLAVDMLGPDATVTVNDKRQVQLTTRSGSASTLNLIQELPADIADHITTMYVSPEGQRMTVRISGDHRAVAAELSQSPGAEDFDIVIFELPSGHSYGSPAAELVAWADAYNEISLGSTASKISLRYLHCAIAYGGIPSSSELQRATRILHRIAPPEVKITLRPGSIAPYVFVPSQPDPSSSLMRKYAKAGEKFVKEWRSLER